MATFSTLLDAVESEQLVRFPEEDELPAPVTPSNGGPAGGEAGTAQPLLAASLALAPRMITCRQCGSSFEAPVRRGRPPTLCDRCR